ncbi:hypothetical protein DL765_010200 [Monosporascus sp. GIB2]|nr:hypothetical protein DL765_010200 [Monosporascus sp. GIB2]
MKGRGLSVRISPLDSAKGIVTPDSRIIVFLDGDNLLLSGDEHRLGLFQHLAHNAASMAWITSCGMVKGRNPDGSFVGGLLRGLGSENPPGNSSAPTWTPRTSRSPDTRWARWCASWPTKSTCCRSSGGVAATATARWTGHAEALRDAAATDDHDMELVALGKLKGPQPLPRDWIEVKVDAVGLNWKDLGLCSGRFDANNLWSEYCGVVTAKGPKMSGLQVGDRVYDMGKGHFGNYTHVPAATAQKMKDGDDPLEMASMPLVYMTVVYAFEHVTQVSKGHKVLIQSATGGLGIAAIQLARAKGAEVIATAGTPNKARFLTQEMNIPVTHVFSSREPADLLRMVQATQRGGFDVILSNASGDMLYESLKALAPLGHLVDVGRMDVNNAKNIALDIFQNSAGSTSLDLNLVVKRDPILDGELLKAVDEHYRAVRIGPIRPATVSDVSQLDQVLLRFSNATHVGKLVISYQNPEAAVKMHRSALPAARFDPEARYIITGGLSGLGRSITRWICDRGARDFIILFRRGKSGASEEVLDLIGSLAARDISLRPVACDVSNREQVMSAIKDASSDSQSLLGAGLLHHGLYCRNHIRVPHADYVRGVEQFLGYFARHRRSLGLPASTLSLGYIIDVGTLTAGTITYNLFMRAKGQTITASQFLRLLEPVILNSRDQVAATAQPWTGRDQDTLSEANIINCIDPAVLAAQKRNVSNKTGGHGGDRGKSAAALLRHQFQLALKKIRETGSGEDEAASRAFVADAVTASVAAMLFVDKAEVNPANTVAGHGVDSLLAAEFRNWLHAAFRKNISMLNLMDVRTSINALAANIVGEAVGK